MTTKRGLITDSFKVMKKSRRGGKRKKSPTPPPAQQAVIGREALYTLDRLSIHWRKQNNSYTTTLSRKCKIKN
uniref:Uncharacterized protein n=1 Tax=Xiphophorus couchianus TaxID=32473 RepID=A0A3B5LVQ4_9TELE